MKRRVHFFRASSIFRSQLDQHGGIRRREVLDLFEHPSQRRVVAYDLLKSTWRGILVRSIERLGGIHCDLRLLFRLQPYRRAPLIHSRM